MRGAIHGTGFCTRYFTRCCILAVLAAVCLSGMLSAPAFAHGGRFARPGGTFKPRDPIRPRPEGAPPRPVTPTAGNPAPTTPRTTNGSGIPTTTGALPDIYWGTWWALNRWAYLPERGEAMRKRRVTTGRAEPGRRAAVARERRALLARQYIKPFLLKQLDDATEDRGAVRAAAVLALAKVSADETTLERILAVAEGGRSTPEERESAALAVGLLRRTDPKLRLDPISLDLARTRLLALIKSRRQAMRGRCFAAFSLGLLSDQGYGSPFTEEGRLVVKGLLDILESRKARPDLSIAVLTALSMQPRKGIPSSLYDNLRAGIVGSQAFGRKWTPLERAHALSAYAQLRGPAWVPLLLRALSDRRIPVPVHRTARLVLGSEAPSLSPEERLEAVRTLLAKDRSPTDPTSAGVGQIALGRVLNADLADGCVTILEDTKAAQSLLKGMTKAPLPVRGFHVLALALAARDIAAPDSEAPGIDTPDTDAEAKKIRSFVRAARKAMLHGCDHPRGDADLKSAYVIGLGLLGVKSAKDRLVKVLADTNAGPALRGRTAIALAAIEAADEDVLKALRAIAADTSPVSPRGAAALALSILTGVPASDMLVEQLRAAKSLRQQTAAAAALGQLDDPKALSAIIQVANQRKSNKELRALAIAVLGLLGDPEENPSLFRLTLDANYIARTDALNEAFTLL